MHKRISFVSIAAGRAWAAALGLTLARGCVAGPAADNPPISSSRRPLAAASCVSGGSSGAGAGGATGAGGGFTVNIPDPPATTPPNIAGNNIQIMNNCNLTLYIRTEGGGSPSPTDMTLAAGQKQQISRSSWPGGWIEAHSAMPIGDTNLLERVEITVVRGDIWYKLQYLNGIALPIEIYASGTGPECNKRTGCYVSRQQVMTDCPDGLLVGQACLAPGVYCADAANQAKPVCHALDSQIAACAASSACGAPAGLTSKQAYDCDKFFGTSYKWCAAINRGMLDSPDSTDSSLFYKKAPYNDFSAWVHSFCHTWAFPYDDYNGATADDTMHTCRTATGASVTFCPNG